VEGSDSKHSAPAIAKINPNANSAANAAANALLTVTEVMRSDIVKVVHTRNGAFSDDTLLVSLWNRETVTVPVFSERAAAFFARILDDSIRAKAHASPDFFKFDIPKAVRYGRALDEHKIIAGLKQHKISNVRVYEALGLRAHWLSQTIVMVCVTVLSLRWSAVVCSNLVMVSGLSFITVTLATH
jgi:hypothetical protein